MLFNTIKKRIFLFFVILLLGVFTTFSSPQNGNANYYLGVLAKGYPPSLVVNEFRFADAQVVNVKDNMVLFAVNEKTKLTTFIKNLPFLKEVYIEATDIGGDASLRKHPLVREFLSFLQKDRVRKSKGKDLTNPETVHAPSKPGNPAKESGMAPDKRARKTAAKGNMDLIDNLIREKAKKIRAAKSAGKKK